MTSNSIRNPDLLIPVISLLMGSLIILILGLVQGVFFSLWTFTGLFVTGFLFFTLIEYLLHRFIFHYHGHNSRQKRWVYLMHGVHHHHPLDISRYRSKFYLRWLIMFVLFFLFKWGLGANVYGLLPGFLVGYAFYLYVHFIVHHCRYNYTWFRRLKKLHDIHHYQNPSVAFGVSSPLWDWVFGTYPARHYFKEPAAS